MKMIRILIVITLILTALALDMSSAKRRASTSAYVALYTSLGLKYGYKELNSDVNYKDYTMNYDVRIKDEKGVEITLSANLGSNQITTESPGMLSFNYNSADESKLPAWLRPLCSFETCKIENCNLFQYFQGPKENLKIDFHVGDKTYSVFLYVTNATDTPKPDIFDGLYPRNLIQKQVEEFKLALAPKDYLYIEYLNKISSSAQSSIDKLEKIKKNVIDDRNTKQKILEEKTKMLNDLRAEKKSIETQITQLNSRITKYTDDVKLLTSQFNKCEAEVQNIALDIVNENTKIQKEKTRIETETKKLQVDRAKAVSLLFYNFEAAYYYRVFSEKIVKTEADATAAVEAKNIETTKTKIINAFYPINVQFAASKAK